MTAPPHAPASFLSPDHGASPDAAILALVPELEAAAREVIAFADRDHFAVPGAPGYDAVMAHGEAVRKRAETVAQHIFAHQPRTLADLLATAHAVAATTGELWDASPIGLEYTDTLLRVLPDKLFALCGVDWRGRPVAEGGAAAPAGATAAAYAVGAPRPDPIHAAIAASRAALTAHVAACNGPDADTPEGEARSRAAGDASVQAWRALLGVQPTTCAGVRALAAYAPAFIRDGAWDDDRDAATLFRTIARAPHASPAQVDPDPVLAAMVAEWEALGAAIDAPGHRGDATEDCRRWTALQREILARPCRTLADLCAKLPLFRNELEEAEPGEPDSEIEGYLELAAWRGLVQDLEALSDGPGRARPASPDRPAAAAAIGSAPAPVPSPIPSLDAALIPLAQAAIAEDRAALAICATAGDDPPGVFARALQLLDLVTGMDARTPAGLAAKARLLIDRMPEVDPGVVDARWSTLALSIARDAARLGAAG